MSEISFEVSNIKDLENKFLEISNVINNKGFDFAALQYSSSPTSNLGGKLDWVNENSLNDIIKKAIINLNQIKPEEADELVKKAEEKERDSNQIVEFTKEIKKKPMEYRMKIIEILWKIVYSDGSNDVYESNLIRRVCGLLYVSDKDSGEIKQKVRNSL